MIRTRRSLGNLIKILGRAGEIRLFEYAIKINNTDQRKENYVDNDLIKSIEDYFTFKNKHQHDEYDLEGVKIINYSVSSNPWKQLSQIKLKKLFNQKFYLNSKNSRLKLDLEFFAERKFPLVEITKQHNQVTALSDLISLGTYFLRMLTHIHLLSFRMPDIPPPNVPRLLPEKIHGLPDPIIHEIDVDVIPTNRIKQLSKGKPVKIRLTRYPNYNTDKEPILFIHGYSATGTTFTNPKGKNTTSLANSLYDKGDKDVWIVDLRSSAGFSTACYPWKIETIALTDLPIAIDYIYNETGAKKIDIFGHCMGSQMISMAILAAGKKLDIPDMSEEYYSNENIFRLGAELPFKINKLILSQSGPVMNFSPENKFRAYLAGHLKDIFPLEDYHLRVSEDPSLTEQLLDRLLSTLPYSKEEFRIENPIIPCKRTYFTGIRHRLDALYGNLFNLVNMDKSILSDLEDYFGPLNLNTVAQSIHFAREEMITTSEGRNKFISYDQFFLNWKFPTLCIHAKDNGVFDFQTLSMAEQLNNYENINVETMKCNNYGHQDSWLGKDKFDSRNFKHKLASYLFKNKNTDRTNQKTDYTYELDSKSEIYDGIIDFLNKDFNNQNLKTTQIQ